MKQIICFLSNYLDTINLEKMSKCRELKKYFLGVYPADITPKITKVPCCWIWNTDEQNKPGQHWVSVWLTNKKMYFFDSFALHPTIYKRDYWCNIA